jgi:hypothetical protein
VHIHGALIARRIFETQDASTSSKDSAHRLRIDLPEEDGIDLAASAVERRQPCAARETRAQMSMTYPGHARTTLS